MKILFWGLWLTAFGRLYSASAVPPDSNASAGLQTEILLHPGEAFTAYTYHKGEFFYAQNLNPYPGFAQVGLSNQLTVGLPFWEWLGRVVSLNIRWKLADQRQHHPALAYETHYQYLPRTIDLLAGHRSLSVMRKGHNWYHHLNISRRIRPPLMVHLSAGLTYSEYLSFTLKTSTQALTETHRKTLTPDLSVGIDWRARPWISFHATASYGSTYMYIDNTARKQQLTLGTRLAPFYASRIGFIRSFRTEVVLFAMKFGRLPHTLISPYGFLYWQWRW